MKPLSAACLFLFPALLASAPRCEAQTKETPEVREQLKKNAAQLEAQITAAPPPGNPELHLKLGFTYSRLEQVDEAQRAFENAVKLDPKKAAAHYMLGLIYEKKGLREKALAAWKACLENTTDPRVRNTAAKHIHHLSR